MDYATMFFCCGSRILQLFCHKVEAANVTLSVAKNNWNENFCRGGKKVRQILSNFTKVLGFAPAIIFSWQLSNSSH